MYSNKNREIASLDYRSLALMRIGFGIVLMLDVIDRVQSLTAHYTDFGTFPRSLNSYGPWNISIHNLGGSALFQGIVFIVTFIFAAFLAVGYRTKISTIFSWFFVLSIQNRNPLVTQGADIILRVVLFWAMFLPWGDRWSLDNFLNRNKPPKEKNINTVATVAYITQIVLFYCFSGILKTGISWQDGTAVYYALSIDQLTTRFGHFLLGFPKFLTFMTHSTVYLERYGPILFIFPFWNPWCRIIGIVAFAMFQVGINMSMSIGLFGAISIIVTLGLLPSFFWDSIVPKFSLKRKTGLTMYYDQDCGFCSRAIFYVRRFLFLSPDNKALPSSIEPLINAKMLEHDSWVVVDEKGHMSFGFDAFTNMLRFSPVWWWLSPFLKLQGICNMGEYFYRQVAKRRLSICLPSKEAARSENILRFLKIKDCMIDAMICVFMVVVILVNMESELNFIHIIPKRMKWIVWIPRMDQTFDMFAPSPLTKDGWHVIPGTLKDGTEVDLFKNGAPVTYEKPALVSRDYPDQRWQKYIMNLDSVDLGNFRLPYAQYLCRAWNKKHQDPNKKLDHLKIIYMAEETSLDKKESAPIPETLLEHDCDAK